MPRSGVGLTTLQKNIARDSRKYYVKHQTYTLLAKLAQRENRPVGHELDVLVEELARVRLSPAEFAKALEEAKAIEEHRREVAEAHRGDLEEKYEERKQRRAAS